MKRTTVASIESFILDEQSAYVKQVHEQWVKARERHPASRSLAFLGVTWPKCFEHHASIRNTLSTHFHINAVSVQAACHNAWTEARQTSPLSPPWIEMLCPREVDVIYLHTLMAEKGLGLSPPLSFHWDIMNNVYMGRNKSQADIVPCISKKHTIWDLKRQKPWFGKELMLVQGFPKDISLSLDDNSKSIPARIRSTLQRMSSTTVSDTDLLRMAGNTMTVPVMMILQVRWPSLAKPTLRYIKIH